MAVDTPPPATRADNDDLDTDDVEDTGDTGVEDTGDTGVEEGQADVAEHERQQATSQRADVARDIAESQTDQLVAIESNNEAIQAVLEGIEDAQKEFERAVAGLESTANSTEMALGLRDAITTARTTLNELAGPGDQPGSIARQIESAKEARNHKQYDKAKQIMKDAYATIKRELDELTKPNPMEATLTPPTQAKIQEMRAETQRILQDLASLFFKCYQTLDAVAEAPEPPEAPEEPPPAAGDDATAEIPSATEQPSKPREFTEVTADIDLYAYILMNPQDPRHPIGQMVNDVGAAIEAVPVPTNWFWVRGLLSNNDVDAVRGAKEAAGQALLAIKQSTEAQLTDVARMYQSGNLRGASEMYSSLFPPDLSSVMTPLQGIEGSEAVSTTATNSLSLFAENSDSHKLGVLLDEAYQSSIAPPPPPPEQPDTDSSSDTEAATDAPPATATTEEAPDETPKPPETKEEFKEQIGRVLLDLREAMKEKDPKKKMAKMLGIAFQALGLLMVGMKGENMVIFGQAASEAWAEIEDLSQIDADRLTPDGILEALKVPELGDVLHKIKFGELYRYWKNPDDPELRADFGAGGMDPDALELLDNLRTGGDSGPKFERAMQNIFSNEYALEYAKASSTNDNSLFEFMNGRLETLAGDLGILSEEE